VAGGEPLALTASRERLAGAPITWGVCEVPGWGPMMGAERVLGEMRDLGLRGTEFGAPGFLPEDPDQVRAMLVRFGLAAVGGFVPLVLHRRDASESLSEARSVIDRFARAGGEVIALALVEDMAWSPPQALDPTAWRRLDDRVQRITALAAEREVRVALHPHVGTLVETGDQVSQALDALTVDWCLDTGHLLIGGVDPAQFALEHGPRVAHVHLKDVDAALADRVRSGALSLLDATRAGLFRPLGEGDVDVKAVLRRLDQAGYNGWLVFEQDTALAGEEPPVGGGPMLDAKASIEYVLTLAQTKEERV
jgi:inosose dehydratase